MKLSEKIIEEIGKKLQIWCPAKHTSMSEDISECIFYLWKQESQEIEKRVVDKTGEIIEKEFKKYTNTQ